MPFKRNIPRNMPQAGDIKDIFIARADELLFFIQRILEPEEPEYNIISISGQGGVGKSTLVNRFIEEAHASSFKDYCLTARVNERQATPANIMERFAEQLREKNHPLKEFEEKLTRYKELIRRIQTENAEEQDILLRETVNLVGTIVEDIPFAGKLMHKEATALTDVLVDKAHRQQYLKDIAKLEDPIRDLTRTFVKDLNQITERPVSVGPDRVKRYLHVVLFFDTFEQLASSVAPWLLNHFLDADISSNVVLVVAGRDAIENSLPDDPKHWLPYLDNQDIYAIPLDSFDEQETYAYLHEKGITDAQKMQQIWQKSHGLPLFLAIWTAHPAGNVNPTADAVENFLRWIPKNEQIKRRLALDAALFSLPFNQDDLAAFSYLEGEQATLYKWLIEQSFVQSNPLDGRYIYHALAQDMFSRHLYQRSHQEYYATRQALADYYQRRIEQLQLSGRQGAYDSERLDLTLALAQQLFLLPDEDSYRQATEQIFIIYERLREPEAITKTLRPLLQAQEITLGGRHSIELVLKSLETNLPEDAQERLLATDEVLRHMQQQPAFSKKACAYLLRRRGHVYRVLKQYEQAIADFDHALTLAADYTRAYVERGLAYRDLKDYERAIQNCNLALAIDPQYVWSYNNRGFAYYALKDYEHALQDYNHALAIDPQYASAYNNRGRLYRTLKDYQHAFQDYNHALALNPRFALAYKNRALTYRDLKDYQRALQDYNRALDIDPQFASTHFDKGYVYLWLRDLHKAKVEFTQSWQMEPTNAKHGWIIEFVEMCQQKADLTTVKRLTAIARIAPYRSKAYICRGVAHLLEGNFEQASQDLEQACRIRTDAEDSFFWSGVAYAYLGQDDKATAVIKKALELGLPPVLLAPLHWLEHEKPAFYQQFAAPLLAQFA